jgi:vacuolar protein sorting-associated protein 26
MELAIVRREACGAGLDKLKDSETMAKFEIMDGAPVKGIFRETRDDNTLSTPCLGECIPVRLYLSGLNLTPTYKNIHNKFSVKYFLNLVLVDEEDRRYFKQQEITIWRKSIGV